MSVCVPERKRLSSLSNKNGRGVTYLCSAIVRRDGRPSLGTGTEQEEEEEEEDGFGGENEPLRMHALPGMKRRQCSGRAEIKFTLICLIE